MPIKETAHRLAIRKVQALAIELATAYAGFVTIQDAKGERRHARVARAAARLRKAQAALSLTMVAEDTLRSIEAIPHHVRQVERLAALKKEDGR